MMKTICVYLIFLLSFINVMIASQVIKNETYTLQVKFSNIKKTGKPVYMAIYRSKEDFDKRKAYKRFVVLPSKQTTLKIDKLSAGNYAILAYQDINGNHRLDFSGYMPVEPWGASNNKILSGPLAWKDIVFELNHNLGLEIKLF